MRVLITGGSGFVGRNLVAYLVRNYPDLKLMCLVRNKVKAEWMVENEQIQMLEGDLHSPLSYHKQAKEADIIIHAAALVGLKNGPEFYEANLKATELLLNSAKAAPRLRRLVFLSTISAVDRPVVDDPFAPLDPIIETTPCHPRTDYGKSKLQAEKLIAASQIPFTILRPSYIYGPHPRLLSSMDRIIQDVQTGKPYTHIPFPGKASHIYVDDLARLIWQSAMHPAAENQIFMAADPEPALVGEVFPKIAKVLQIPYDSRPMTAAQLKRFQQAMYHRHRGNHPGFPVLRVMFEDSFYCNASKVTNMLAWKPSLTLDEGIGRTISWYRQHGYL